MRHLTKTKETLQNLNNLHIPYLITRCLDIELDNKVERLQALKLVRNLAFISHQSDNFPVLLLRSVVAIAEGGKKEDDRLYRVALALLCEMSVINPNLFMVNLYWPRRYQNQKPKVEIHMLCGIAH